MGNYFYKFVFIVFCVLLYNCGGGSGSSGGGGSISLPMDSPPFFDPDIEGHTFAFDPNTLYEDTRGTISGTEFFDSDDGFFVFAFEGTTIGFSVEFEILDCDLSDSAVKAARKDEPCKYSGEFFDADTVRLNNKIFTVQ